MKPVTMKFTMHGDIQYTDDWEEMVPHIGFVKVKKGYVHNITDELTVDYLARGGYTIVQEQKHEEPRAEAK